MSNNPNATAAGLSGAITLIVVWLCGYFGLDVTAEVASAFTTIVAATVLWFGKRSKRNARRA